MDLLRFTNSPGFIQFTRILLASILALAILTITTGCATSVENIEAVSEEVDFWLEPSHGSIYTGETVTVVAQTHNLLASDAEIDWESNGGDLERLNETIARVTFDEPGRFMVKARLMIDDEPIQSDEVVIDVRQLPI